MTVRIQTPRIDPFAELQRYREYSNSQDHGAVATFTGVVRGSGESDGERIHSMTLEHYPRMTQKQVQKIVAEACERWEIGDPLVIHRVGRLQKGDDIVFLAVSSKHRKEAFEACEFIVDHLKTCAPFWKKEITSAGEHWVEQRDQDRTILDRWEKKPDEL